MHNKHDGVCNGLNVLGATIFQPLTDDANDAVFAKSKYEILLLLRQVLPLQNHGHISCFDFIAKLDNVVKFNKLVYVIYVQIFVLFDKIEHRANHLNSTILAL